MVNSKSYAVETEDDLQKSAVNVVMGYIRGLEERIGELERETSYLKAEVNPSGIRRTLHPTYYNSPPS